MFKRFTVVSSFLVLLFFSVYAQDVPSEKYFYIQSALESGNSMFAYWDVPGGPEDYKDNRKQEIKLWRIDGGYDRMFKFEKLSNGRYKIRAAHLNSSRALNYDPSNKGDGSDIYIGDDRTKSCEFVVKYSGNGKWRILSPDNRVVCTNGRKSNNGINVHLWGDHPGEWTEWMLVDVNSKQVYKPENVLSNNDEDIFDVPVPVNEYFIIQSMNNVGKNIGGCFDIGGEPKSIKRDEQHNLMVWDYRKAPDRLYKFVKLANGNYKIVPQYAGDGFCVMADSRNWGNSSNVFIGEDKGIENEFKIIYTGNGLWRIQTLDGRIICLDGRSSKNRSNIHLWEKHTAEGTLWALVRKDDRSVYYPEGLSDYNSITAELTPGKNSEKFVKDLDQAYSDIAKMNKRLDNLYNSMGASSSSFSELTSMVERLDVISKNCDDTKEVTSTFHAIPVVGIGAKSATASLNAAKGISGEVNDVISPLSVAGIRLNTIRSSTLQMVNELDEMNISLGKVKKQYADAAKCASESNDPKVKADFEQKSANASNYLASLKKDMGDIDKGIGVLEKLCSSFGRIKGHLAKVDKGIKKTESSVKKIGDGARDVDSKLSHKFKKDIKIGIKPLQKTIKVRISVKDILTGGGAFKKVAKYIGKATKWAGDLVKPGTDKLKEKIEKKIPGLNELKKEIANIKSDLNKMKQNTLEYANFSKKISESKNGLEKELSSCIEGAPCAS